MTEAPPAGASVPTVYGAPLSANSGLMVDGHEHAWIAPPPGAPPEHAIHLADEERQVAALSAYAKAAQEYAAAGRSAGPAAARSVHAPARSGGASCAQASGAPAAWRAGLIDCQPPFAGRDAVRLADISRRAGVAIACVTGFHLTRYYADGKRPWRDEAEAAELFVREVTSGLVEAAGLRAAAIKAAHSGSALDDLAAWEAAVEAQRRTGACLLIHTERGAGAAELLAWLTDRGVAPGRVYLCHMDKRPDVALHAELAQAGAMLGYDTFPREKYEPDRNAWPLLWRMVERGFGASVALGLDLAGSEFWQGPSGGPAAFVTVVAARVARDCPDASVRAGLLGANVLGRLARGAGERVSA